jgi:hypothetical protein
MPTPPKMAEIVGTFVFVVAEVDRLNALVQAGHTKEALSQCGLASHLPLARGEFPCGGHYMCSRAADERLIDLVQSCVTNDHELRDRIRLNSYYGPLKAELGIRAARDRELITDVLAKQMLQAAKSAALAKLVKARYYLPVFCINQEGVDEFILGAVHFERTDRFFEKHRPEWDIAIEQSVAENRAAAQELGQTADVSWPRELFAHVKQHVCDHRWIASVEIDGAEKSVGWNKAEYVIDQTCSLLRLLLKARDDSHIGVASHSQKQRSDARFMLPAEGRYETWVSSSVVDYCVEANFLAQAPLVVPGFSQIETAVSRLSGWSEPSVGEQRLLAALNWFGEAWKDRHPEARLVKFTICLEGLLMTGDREGLTEMLAERLALLVETDYEAVNRRYAEMREVYSARSKAVHGDTARRHLNFARLSRTAEDLARVGLLAYAQLAPMLEDSADVKKTLGEFFTALKLGGFKAALATLPQRPHSQVGNP